MKTWMIVVLAVFTLAGFIYLGGQSFDSGVPAAHESSPGDSSGSAPTTSTSESASSTSATSEPELILINNWSGTGIKTTESFSISKSPWNIVWTNNPETYEGQSVGTLQIMVYSTEVPDIPIAFAANTQKEETDITYIYETGTFYLTVLAANTDWEVSVFAPSN